MSSLPIVLKNKNILLIGGGAVALQKAQVLENNGFVVLAIAKEFCQGFDELTHSKVCKSFEESDIKNYPIVIDATGDASVLETLLALKEERWFFLNVVDVPEHCDFYFAALCEMGDLKISVSSNGASPTIAKKVRDFILNTVPSRVQKLLNQEKQKRAEGIIEPEKIQNKMHSLLYPVYLISAGTGGREMLTMQAHELLQNATDVVLYDALVSQDILDSLPSDVEQVSVGKRKGNHSATQERIHETMLHYHKQGKRVARLKAGEASIFGRLYEEIHFLNTQNIQYELVHGVSSFVSGTAAAHIPLTHRGYSSGFSVVSACLQKGKSNFEWIDLLNKTNHTTVVLMGLTLREKIQKNALENNINPNLGVAFISNISRDNQSKYITKIGDMHDIPDHIIAPAIMVFGEVVGLGKKDFLEESFLEAVTPNYSEATLVNREKVSV